MVQKLGPKLGLPEQQLGLELEMGLKVKLGLNLGSSLNLRLKLYTVTFPRNAAQCGVVAT